MTSTSNRIACLILTGALLITAPAAAARPSPTRIPRPTTAAATLPLGPGGLPETRTTTTLQPGVTLQTIVRGTVDPDDFWTVETSIPATSTSPDPDAPPLALSDQASAEAQAQRLSDLGYQPRVEEVVTPATDDFAGGSLGWRVRVGAFASKAEADALLARLVAAGFAGSSAFTGWDGSATDEGPWRLRVLTIDPRRFRGALVASFGPDIEQRETTSALSRAAGATAGVNGGYFVLDPAAGAPGDPAGVGVYRGRLLSETVGNRPALVLDQRAEHSRVQRLHWRGVVTQVRPPSRTPRSGHGLRLALDGIDRVPGLIRNCGGTADDQPTSAPLHDFTCTDADELVAFTSQYGPVTPSGPGLEAVLDKRGRVVSLRTPRGGPLARGYRSVQATGSLVDTLRRLAVVGKRLTVSTSLRTANGDKLHQGPGTSVVNGGPMLVRNGRVHVTPRVDGFVRPTNPSTYYGFSAKRNPRTFAGVDAQGRTLLVTVDGRSTSSLGLTIVETAAVARALGMRDALNLDGGGSTTTVVGGEVINQPSDTAGERPVGDALLVLPRTRATSVSRP
jgi:hypothetical protein